MFRIEQVGRRGWFNTPVTIVATEPMKIEEERVRSDNLHVMKLSNWLLQINEGERFEVQLPNGVHPKIGDTLKLTTVMRDRLFKSRWTKVSTF